MIVARITAVAPQGYKQIFRAGRAWPHATTVTVQVLDQDADPPAPAGLPAHPTQIGKASLAKLQGDKRLAVQVEEAEGDALAPSPSADPATRAVQLEEQVAALAAKVDTLATQVAQLLAGSAAPEPPKGAPKRKGAEPAGTTR